MQRIASFLIILVGSFLLVGCSSPSQTANNKQDHTFGKYKCTSNCSGHKAGYNWAEKKNINDPSDCSGNSQSFIEGCMEYAEEY